MCTERHLNILLLSGVGGFPGENDTRSRDPIGDEWPKREGLEGWDKSTPGRYAGAPLPSFQLISHVSLLQLATDAVKDLVDDQNLMKQHDNLRTDRSSQNMVRGGFRPVTGLRAPCTVQYSTVPYGSCV